MKFGATNLGPFSDFSPNLLISQKHQVFPLLPRTLAMMSQNNVQWSTDQLIPSSL